MGRRKPPEVEDEMDRDEKRGEGYQDALYLCTYIDASIGSRYLIRIVGAHDARAFTATGGVIDTKQPLGRGEMESSPHRRVEPSRLV